MVSDKLPKLAIIATQLLAIHATSTASERVFFGVWQHTERRCRMQPRVGDEKL